MMLVVEQPSSKLSTNTSPPWPRLLYSRQSLLVYSRRLSPQIWQDPGDQALRRVLFKRHHQSTASSAPSTIIRCSSGLTGGNPLSAVWWRHRCSQRQSNVTQFTGICQIRDVPGVQDVKTPLVITTFSPRLRAAATASSVPLRSSRQSLYLHVHVQHFQLDRRNRGGSQFADHHASRRLAKKQASSSELPAASVAARSQSPCRPHR